MQYLENPIHLFHIPVMGTSFTIDTPLRVGKYGIDSVVSIIDDQLVEVMRQYHSKRLGIKFISIPDAHDDCRAERIRAYLDFLHDALESEFEELKKTDFEPGSDINKYFEMLPDESSLKQDFHRLKELAPKQRKVMEAKLRSRMRPGRIDVNIMTKIDNNPNKLIAGGESSFSIFNDAHAALRGFANSKICSTLVLSAGMNPRLFGYMATFPAFFPDEDGHLKKKIAVKVSDYRSALIQGKFLAKKGLWVSEFRVESGLNCGGHAFATEGFLLGPILHEFKENREHLIATMFAEYKIALLQRNGHEPTIPAVRLSVQGGVGTASEQSFLLEEYSFDSIGWGSPFLLVDEAVNIDEPTQKLLSQADESQFYTSNASPLGIHFNTVRSSQADRDRLQRISLNKPGSPCYKKHLAFNTDFGPSPICTASRKFQHKEIARLNAKISDKDVLKRHIERVCEKVCLCVGLGNAALVNAEAKLYRDMKGVAVCPGPNLAYFSERCSLKDMVNHIYGRHNLIKHPKRPNLFIKELSLYLDFLKARFRDIDLGLITSEYNTSEEFIENLLNGIDYYLKKAKQIAESFHESTDLLVEQLLAMRSEALKLQLVVIHH